jgi:hypothetical protein
MITINSLSGGKTSSYIAANYPADYNVFALVRTNDKKCLFPDPKIRQVVSDKIGTEFIGTLEMDEIIYTMLDLEQFIGKEITWLSQKTFDEVIASYKMANNSFYLPNQMTRYCTTDLKIKPIAQWCYENTDLPIEMRIGFRANEISRANKMIERQINGIENFKFKIGEKNGRNKWQDLPYRMVRFPLIEDVIFKDTIENFWQGKPVLFAQRNNCVGCFHRNELLLNYLSAHQENKFNWFIDQEQKNGNTFKKGITYEKIKQHKLQLELFEDDFNECDSGYCGL